jgi:ribosome-binding protein aMBF1 (putative translation factor)
VLSLESSQIRRNHNWLKSLSFFFSPALSQEALAHECGINRTYLSGVERSERNVSIDNIARIARRLKVKPYVLLDDSP